MIYQTFYKKQRHKRGISVLLIVCGVLLNACTSSSENFDSDPGKGVGAKSITEVNSMVNQGTIQGVFQKEKDMSMVPPVFVHQAEKTINPEVIVLSDKTMIQRQPEQHRRVWIAPFQDEVGNFHEGTVIHTLMRSSYWQVQPNPLHP